MEIFFYKGFNKKSTCELIEVISIILIETRLRDTLTIFEDVVCRAVVITDAVLSESEISKMPDVISATVLEYDFEIFQARVWFKPYVRDLVCT